MTDAWTDDEIAELFASANPVPDMHRHFGGTEIGLAPPHDAHGVDLGDHPVQPTDERGERWGLLVGVAATVALVVSLIVTTTVDEGEPAPADEVVTNRPADTVADVPAVESTDLDTVERFIAAFNGHDVEAMIALSTDSLVFDRSTGGADNLTYLVEWYASFEWRWEEATCTTVGSDEVSCDVAERNRLSDFADVERTAEVAFTLDDGKIARVEPVSDLSRYSPEAFMPFYRWVNEHHPDAAEQMWNSQGGGVSPVIGAQTPALFDWQLAEYIGMNGDEPGVRHAYEFIAALNDGDAEAARSVLVPGHEPRLVLTDGEPADAPTLDDQVAWLHAFGTIWDRPVCEIGGPSTRVVCRFELRNRLADAQSGSTMSTTALFEVRDEAIELTTSPQIYPPMSYDAFIYWVNATDPDVAHRIWLNGDEDQIVTEESVHLLDEQLTAYLASDVVGLEPDETAASALVDALTARDATELDQVVTADVGELAGWERSSWAEMLTWMEANQEEWHLKACNPVAENQHGCEIDVMDPLAEAAGVLRPVFAVIEVTSDRISAITISDQSDDYRELALRPFLDWLQAEHPDEFDEVWTTVDGEFTPQPTARAAELHAQHVAEYAASQGLP